MPSLLLLGNERSVDVAALIHEVLNVYAAESYGDDTFTRWVLLGLRTGEGQSLKLAVWHALEELVLKMSFDVLPESALQAWEAHTATEATAGSSTGDADLSSAWATSLRRGRLSHAGPESFLRRLAEHHVDGKALRISKGNRA